MRRIGVVTCGRSDVGFYLPLLQAMAEHPSLEPELIATGMHLSTTFGLTVRQFEEAGYPVRHRVPSLLAFDAPEGVAASMGVGTQGFAQLFANRRPDVLLVHGDRTDTLPAAVAALPFRLPVAHIAGGDVTEGAIDDAVRHALTKLSHLHFVELPSAARRVEQMGEEPWRISVCGALALDAMARAVPMTDQEFEETFRLPAGARFLLVTYHPVTLQPEQTGAQIEALLAALEDIGRPCVFTYPNADVGSHIIIQALQRFCARRGECRLVVNAGPKGYWSLMRAATAMVGNSSSGIVEAASCRLPVVNVGIRQQGRLRPANVVDAEATRASISSAIRQATAPAFRARLASLTNPYGDSHAAERIAQRLAEVELSDRLLMKRFHDIAPEHGATAASLSPVVSHGEAVGAGAVTSGSGR